MSENSLNGEERIMSILVAFVLAAAFTARVLGAAYLVVCVIVNFLAFCFGFVFSFKLALGVFTILCIFLFLVFIFQEGE